MAASELDNMLKGTWYDLSKAEVVTALREKQERQQRLNALLPDNDGYRAALKALIPGIPDTVKILPPFRCDYGRHLRIGDHVFINANCTMLDTGGITIGAHTRIGPDCHLYTPIHPFDAAERRTGRSRALPITIGEDCWLGGNVTVCPGVTIGDRTIVGAGSVVTHDLPSDVLAAGNPAEVKRQLDNPQTDRSHG